MRGTVLVVDDDPGIRRCLGEFLEAEGFKVLSASNGRAALAVLEDELPDFLLVDVAMPVMDGEKLVEALDHYPDLARIPRIMLGERSAPDEGVPTAVARVASKPIDLGSLASTMSEMLAAAA
jgi:chemosensory pili system protein ChpA (sensor histidine kinase/response regulator)